MARSDTYSRIEELRRRLEKLEDKETWRTKEARRWMALEASNFQLTNDERQLAFYLLEKAQKWGIKSIYPTISLEELFQLLFYIALRHRRRKHKIQEHRDYFFFNPNNKALVAITNILSHLLKERGLTRRQ